MNLKNIAIDTKVDYREVLSKVLQTYDCCAGLDMSGAYDEEIDRLFSYLLDRLNIMFREKELTRLILNKNCIELIKSVEHLVGLDIPVNEDLDENDEKVLD